MLIDQENMNTDDEEDKAENENILLFLKVYDPISNTLRMIGCE
jgi:hypothetical protein